MPDNRRAAAGNGNCRSERVQSMQGLREMAAKGLMILHQGLR